MDNRIRMALAFIAGAAVGSAITYLLASDKGENAVDEFRRMAEKLKNDLNARVGKRKPGTGPAPIAGEDKADDFVGI